MEKRRAELGALSADELKRSGGVRGLELPGCMEQSRKGTQASALARVAEGTAEGAVEESTEDGDTGQAAVRREERLRDIITEALDLAEVESERAFGYMCDMPYMMRV